MHLQRQEIDSSAEKRDEETREMIRERADEEHGLEGTICPPTWAVTEHGRDMISMHLTGITLGCHTE